VVFGTNDLTFKKVYGNSYPEWKAKNPTPMGLSAGSVTNKEVTMYSQSNFTINLDIVSTYFADLAPLLLA